ncbi:hypothetical protein DEO72_LG3g1548 [Vigna unguiculata]|uniref:Uncharacterized protein n=1 Tax=Vigna unguiculata TaxID=3917 RepID=A0A4D6LEL5_VIGUN|nr:hypothetical protein DEO72_LG3g1548 [Vigna unguiculata]
MRGFRSKGFGDHYHVEDPYPKAYTVRKYDFVSEKIRPIPRRGSTSKGFGDHYHVKGLDPKT